MRFRSVVSEKFKQTFSLSGIYEEQTFSAVVKTRSYRPVMRPYITQTVNPHRSQGRNLNH